VSLGLSQFGAQTSLVSLIRGLAASLALPADGFDSEEDGLTFKDRLVLVLGERAFGLPAGIREQLGVD
jgi:hypothetical protein